MSHQILGGRYQIIRQLGGGGFGRTYLAEDQHLPGKPFCVVKQLQPKVTQPEALLAARRLFDTEAEVLHALGHHPQIPRLTAHFQQDQEFYLVQEFVQGTVLNQEFKQRKTFSELEVLDLLTEILTVLEFVHGHQVIHRDLKPANLIRRQADGKIVLIDFGAVKQVAIEPGGSNPLTVVVGSTGYSPSEQLAGRACFGSDLYAIGVIAIQALTGIAPKNLIIDPDSHELQWRDRATVSDGLAEILDRMVRYDFRQRYRTIGEVTADLQTLDRSQISSQQSEDGSQAWIERGESFYQQNSYREALAAFDEAVQANPLSPMAWLKRGLVLEMLQQFSAALTCYDRVLQFEPNNHSVWSKRGVVLENLLRYEEALASYRRVVELQPRDYWAWHDHGKVLEQLGQMDAALVAYKKAIAIKSDFQLAVESRKRLLSGMRRLDLLLELQHYDEALTVADLILKEKPEDGTAWLAQGIALSKQQRYEAALTALDVALAILGGSLAGWLERGQVLQAMLRYPEAVMAYDEAIALQGDNQEAWLKRAICLEQLQQYEAAMLSYNQVMEFDSTLQVAVKGRERTLRCLQLQTAAAWQEAEAEAIDEDDSTVLGPLAPVAIPYGELASLAEPMGVGEGQSIDAMDEPLTQMDGMEAQSPIMVSGVRLTAASGPRSAGLQGKILEKLRSHRETVAAYNRAIQSNPDDPAVSQWRGNLLVALGRYEEAIGAYDRAIQARPENPTLWCCLAGALVKLKRYREAVSCFERAAQLDPASHTPWYWRGRVLCELKRFPEAVVSFDQALVIRPDFQPAVLDRAKLKAMIAKAEAVGTLA
jgi:tetratricopeptide (TPR) repeat protein